MKANSKSREQFLNGASLGSQTTIVRIATWNIRAGGGKRTAQIARVILEERPDVLVLTEYRPAPGRLLLELLEDLSYHVAAGVPTAIQNCVCVLSRHPVEPHPVRTQPKSLHRWMPVFIPAFNLTILGVHVPNQFEIWHKREFWDCVEGFATENVGTRTVIIGDLNTALDEDCEGDPIREAVYFKRLLEASWVDAWRSHNSKAREFSWFSHRANGFRLDHCLVSPSLASSVLGSTMRHDVRTERLSDHSLLTVTFTPSPFDVWAKAGGRG